MFKHILLLVGLSVAAIFLQDQLLAVLHAATHIHDQIAKVLGSIFSLNSMGEVVQSVLALLLIPIVVGALVAIAHFFIKQQQFPHTLTVIWIVWAIFLVSVLSENGHVTNQSAQEIRDARQTAEAAKELQQAELNGSPLSPPAQTMPGSKGVPAAANTPAGKMAQAQLQPSAAEKKRA